MDLQTWTDTVLPSLLLAVFPVGSIYQTTDGESPASKYGGSWERIRDRFLIGASSASYTVNSQGGEANHKLTESELPNHRHRNYNGGFTFCNSNGQYGQLTLVSLDSEPEKSVCFHGGPLGRAQEAAADYNNSYTEYTGGATSHNNIPPYYAVYIYRRVS